MTVSISEPEYGGTFQTDPASLPLRFVLPGEVVDATEVLEPSADRTPPRCPHFGTCGGCDYQHATYPAQLKLKEVILRQTLESSGLAPLPDLQIHASEPWEYRNRIRLRVEQVQGVFRVGYNRRASRDFLPIVECPISAPILLRAAFALIEAADSDSIIAAWLPSIAEVELQTSGDVVQMTVLTRNGRTDAFTTFCEAMQRHLPELAGAGCLAASAGYGAKERARWGVGGLVHHLQDQVQGRKYWVSRGGFFQVNRFLVSRMIELVTQGRAGALAWDLFAGVGLFSRALTASFDAVVAVESSAVASADLAAAAMADRTGRLRPVHAETADFLRRSVIQRERPDLIVIDPPRAGLGSEVCALLSRIAAPKLVYVSCDPTTLARDLAMLVHSGYCLTEVHLLDMFPQTFHLETIVFLAK